MCLLLMLWKVHIKCAVRAFTQIYHGIIYWTKRKLTKSKHGLWDKLIITNNF